MDNLYYIKRSKIITFAPIEPVVKKVVEKSVKWVPIVDPCLRYRKTAQKVTKFSNPIKAFTYTASILLEICDEKYAKYVTGCIVWSISTTVDILIASPTFVSFSLEIGN